MQAMAIVGSVDELGSVVLLGRQDLLDWSWQACCAVVEDLVFAAKGVLVCLRRMVSEQRLSAACTAAAWNPREV